MAVTEASLRSAVRLKLESAEPRLRPFTTTLTNSPGAAGTTFSVADGDAFQVGDLVEGPAGELSLVTAISTNNLTVSRSYGTVAAETAATGDRIRKNPRYTYEQVGNEIDTTLRELRGNGIYSLTTETVVYTVEDWYDVTDTAMEDVLSAWYIDDDEFRTPFFTFNTDPANTQPKVWLSCFGFTGNVQIYFKTEYTAVTDLLDRVGDILVNQVVYKMLGMALAVSTTDPARRVDRTKQGGQEGRDSIWFLREFIRLRDLEIARLARETKKVPKNLLAQRARRFTP